MLALNHASVSFIQVPFSCVRSKTEVSNQTRKIWAPVHILMSWFHTDITSFDFKFTGGLFKSLFMYSKFLDKMLFQLIIIIGLKEKKWVEHLYLIRGEGGVHFILYHPHRNMYGGVVIFVCQFHIHFSLIVRLSFLPPTNLSSHPMNNNGNFYSSLTLIWIEHFFLVDVYIWEIKG